MQGVHAAGGGGSQLPASASALPQPCVQATRAGGWAPQKRALGLDALRGNRTLAPSRPRPPGAFRSPRLRRARRVLPGREPTRSCPGAGGSGSPSTPLVPTSPGGPPFRFSVFSLFALRWICLRSGEGKSALSPGHFRTSKYNQCPEPGGAEAEIHPGQDQPSHLSRLR